MTQIPLFHPSRQAQAFQRFHAANPVVYEALRNLALQLVAAGRRSYGIMALLNVVRWQMALELSATDEFRINNNLAPWYARLLMAQEPALRGFFDTRRSIADEEEP